MSEIRSLLRKLQLEMEEHKEERELAVSLHEMFPAEVLGSVCR
jgi:hypothetical protein